MTDGSESRMRGAGPRDLRIRGAGEEEAPVVSAILTEAALWIRRTHEPLWDPAQVAVDRVAPECRKGLFYLAWQGDEAVGTVRLTRSDPAYWPEAAEGEALYLHKLALRRRAAGRRASTQLLRFAVERTRALERPFLRLDAESSRTRLRRVYEDFGFRFHSLHEIGDIEVARYELEV